MALYLKIHDTNGLELDPYVIHPVVKIHIMDLRSHRYIEKREMNGVINYNELIG